MTAVAVQSGTAAWPVRPGFLGMDSRRGLCGIAWMSLAQAAGLGIRLGSNLILSRLLAPEVYGVVGPALAVLMTLEWFCDLGIRPALVRDPQGGTIAYLSTGWWMGLVRAAGLGAIVAGLALPLARFYAQPELGGVLAALALLPLLQALRSPGLPVLRRELNYRALFVDEVGQTLTGAAVTLVAGWALRSAWAIVAGTLAGATAGVLISYLLCPVRPLWVWDRQAAGRILHVSRQVLLNTLVMALWLNSDRLLGLRLVSLEQMGLYAVAWSLAGVFDSLLSRGCDVYFSLLSRTADPAERAAWHDRACAGLAWAAMPALALGIVLAPWVIRLLYDARYAGAGILFALLVARLMVRSLGQVQFQYLLARAEIGVASRAYGVALLAQAALMIPLAQRWGGMGLALAALVSTIVLTLTQSLLLWRRGQCRLAPCFLTLGWMLLGLLLLFQVG